MASKQSLAAYKAVYVLDSQLALEAKPPTSWSWTAADITDPILLLVLPQMLSEVDSKKRDGRLGERARAFNRLIEPCTLSPDPLRLMETPQVDIALCASGRIDWAALDDLDPAQGDDRLVAEALHALVDDPDRLCMLSYDTRPRAAAIRHGLAAMKPPEDWMLPPEPGPADKEIMRLKQKVAELGATRPDLSLALADADAGSVILPRVLPVDEDVRPYVSRLWLEQNPRSGRSMIDMDFSYDGRYDDYKAWIDAYPARVHRALQTFHGQRRLSLRVENLGAVAAEHLEIVVHVTGGRLHDRLQLKDVLPPKAPRRDPNGPLLRAATVMPRLANRPSRIDVAFDEDTAGSDRVRFACEDFRQGRVWNGELFVDLDPDNDPPAVVDVRVTARNLPGEVRTGLNLAFEVKDTPVEDLIDLSTMKLKRASPHATWMGALSRSEWDDKIELGRREF